jgi:hypothetical protein
VTFVVERRDDRFPSDFALGLQRHITGADREAPNERTKLNAIGSPKGIGKGWAAAGPVPVLWPPGRKLLSRFERN